VNPTLSVSNLANLQIVSKKFLPMKTPLDESYDHLIESPKYRFHPSVVFQTPLVDSEPGAKIGLWIDLTNSDHFYNGDEVIMVLWVQFMLLIFTGAKAWLQIPEDENGWPWRVSLC